MQSTRFGGSAALFAALLSLGLVLLPGCSTSSSSQAGEPAAEENAIVHSVTEADREAAKSKAPITAGAATLWVNGLGCPLCASNLDKQLLRVRGVETVTIDMAAGTTRVAFEPNASVSPAQLGEAVEDAGFTLVKVESISAGGGR
jgi:copper chaperone CopZ